MTSPHRPPGTRARGCACRADDDGVSPPDCGRAAASWRTSRTRDTSTTSTDARPDVRALLAGGPDRYVAQRDQLAKELRAAGDREAAAWVKSLTRPTLGTWAVLAAAADEALVRAAYASTAELVRVQGAAADRAAIGTATAARRAAMERIVSAAKHALSSGSATSSPGTVAGRDAEIRALVERLTRHPELADDWVAGTLRDAPEAGLGFDAFASVDVADVPRSEPRPSGRGASSGRAEPRRGRHAGDGEPAPEPSRRRGQTDRPTATAQPDSRATLAEARQARERAEAERAAARAERAEAKASLATAERTAASARRTLDAARRAKADADEALHRAELASAAAQQDLEEARSRLEASRRIG